MERIVFPMISAFLFISLCAALVDCRDLRRELRETAAEADALRREIDELRHGREQF